MAIQVQSQVRALAKLVARAFAAADLDPEVCAAPQIELTNLPWSVPPLLTSATIGGEALEEYFDQGLRFSAPDMMKFWQQSMQDIWHTPGLVIKGGTYKALGSLLRMTKVGSRVLRFAQPPGYPGQFEMTAGIQLSLEVAHAVYISLPVRKRVLTISDYYVELADGTRFGVMDGRPLVESPWEYDASGEVLDFLEKPRGPTTTQCHYDQIAALRSTLHVHREKFRGDFEGLDQALQALRYLSWGSHCPDLTTAVQTAPTDIPLLRMREQALRDAREVMESTRLNDRQKLGTLRTLLVPTVMGLSRYRREIYASDHLPFTMAAAKETAIKEWLRTHYETEIPTNMRKM